jgi:glycine cleavage system H protein
MSATSSYPDDLLYTKEHEWARIEEKEGGAKVATIGITRFAVEQLGDVTQIDLPKEGETIKQSEVFGSVESVKAVSDLFAPFTGKVVKTNSPLGDSPEYVNEDPYDEGWMIQIALSNPDEIKGLMDADTYQAFLREQAE